MLIMLDCSPKKIAKYTEKYNYEFGQLRTPLTQYRYAGVRWGLDNGCFTTFKERTWSTMLTEAKCLDVKPTFVCLPDVVGDARRTLELFTHFEVETMGMARALVLQDGIGGFSIPWNKISAVFVGGSDKFKESQEAQAACRAAKVLGKWVHVGRVNTAERTRFWLGKADSLDGSGISRYDHMLEAVLETIREGTPKAKAKSVSVWD